MWFVWLNVWQFLNGNETLFRDLGCFPYRRDLILDPGVLDLALIEWRVTTRWIMNPCNYGNYVNKLLLPFSFYPRTSSPIFSTSGRPREVGMVAPMPWACGAAKRQAPWATAVRELQKDTWFHFPKQAALKFWGEWFWRWYTWYDLTCLFVYLPFQARIMFLLSLRSMVFGTW